MNNTFYKKRRLKSLLFFVACSLLAIIPHSFDIKNFSSLIFAFCVVIAFYGLLVISKNIHRSVISNTFNKNLSEKQLPVLDILVAARDEENVIARLVERLFNLDYPRNKLNIYIIDDGSSDKTPLILERLSKEYEKLKIISRSPNAGGGKSGAIRSNGG